MLPDGLEDLFWLHPATARYVLFWDRIGLVMGMAMHMMMEIKRVPWYTYVTPYFHIGPVLQFFQVSWTVFHSDSYMVRRQPTTLVQRLRWFVISTLILVYLPSETFMASFLAATPSSSNDAWRALLQLVALFATPPIFVVLVHGLPFRHQLGAAAIHVLQHVACTLRHEQFVIGRLGLQPQLTSLCSAMCVVLDPSMSYPLQPPPTWCGSPRFHTCLLVYLHVMLALIIPLHLIHTAEYNSKVRFLCSQQGPAGSRRMQEYSTKSWCLCFMQCWATCAVAWCVLTVVFSSLYRS
jgi:hypothetical protein